VANLKIEEFEELQRNHTRFERRKTEVCLPVALRGNVHLVEPSSGAPHDRGLLHPIASIQRN